MIDFDRHSHTYSAEVAGAVRLPACGDDFFLASKGDHLIKLLAQHRRGVSKVRILDVGCGVGLLESHLGGGGELLIGVDVATDALRLATRAAPQASFVAYDGVHFPFPESSFDVAVTICMFHHVEPRFRLAIAKEMARVVRPGGLVVVFEHNPWNPATRVVVSRCELDRDARLLSAPAVERLLREAKLQRLRRQFMFFFPWPGRFWRRIESHLGWLPLGAQFAASAVRPEKGIAG